MSAEREFGPVAVEVLAEIARVLQAAEVVERAAAGQRIRRPPLGPRDADAVPIVNPQVRRLVATAAARAASPWGGCSAAAARSRGAPVSG
jgi:hypothetical protein